MIKRIIFAIVLLGAVGAFASCQSDEERREKETVRPTNYLDKEEMIEAMVDFRIAEASIRQMAAKGENTNKITPYYYQPMLDKHQITIQDYYDNLSYYARFPEAMDEIYKEVVNRLIEIQTDVRNQ